MALVAVFGLAISGVLRAGAALKSEDAFAPVQNSIIVPQLLLSGILLPKSLAPAWLFIVSRFNPFVYVVDAARTAFIGNLTSTTVLIGVGATVALSIAAVTFGARTFQRESAWPQLGADDQRLWWRGVVKHSQPTPMSITDTVPELELVT